MRIYVTKEFSTIVQCIVWHVRVNIINYDAL